MTLRQTAVHTAQLASRRSLWRRWVAAAVFVSALIFAGSTSASETTCRPLKSSARVRVDMAATPLRDVARAVSCWLNLNLVVSPGIATKKLTLVAPHPVKKKTLLPLFRRSLALAGLHLDLTRGHGVIRTGHAPPAAPSTPRRGLHVRVRYVGAKALAAAVGRLCGQPPLVLPRKPVLVLVGDAATQRAQRRWIKWLDRRGQAQKIYLVRVHHRDPTRLAELVRVLLKRSGRRVRVIGNPRTKQVIVVSKPKDWPLIHAAIQRLDIPPR